jgi:hypothetical protein
LRDHVDRCGVLIVDSLDQIGDAIEEEGLILLVEGLGMVDS